MELDIIRREGKRLIKYTLNPADTKHVFCYKLKGMYYTFSMYCGKLIDPNGNEIKNTDIKGSKRKGKYFKEWYESSRNQWYKL